MLKRRVISGFVMIVLIAIIFLADEKIFVGISMAVAFWGMFEIFLANKYRADLDNWVRNAVFIILPLMYFFLTVVLMNNLRWYQSGWWFLLAIVATAAYDTIAFFIGRSIGRHKIAPNVSPKKTWEGTIGGFAGSIPMSVVIGSYLSLDLGQSILLGMLIGVLAFFGDLSVSWYKRQLDIKDMGTLIPGHGGLLDRIDSHMLSMWGIFFFLMLT